MKRQTVDSGKKDFEVGGTTYRVRYYVKDCNPRRYEIQTFLFEVSGWRFLTWTSRIDFKSRFIEKDTPHLDRNNFGYNYTLREKSLEEWVKGMVRGHVAAAKDREQSREVSIDL